MMHEDAVHIMFHVLHVLHVLHVRRRLTAEG